MEKIAHDELLNEIQLSLRLGCSKSKLRQDRCRGRGLPYIKVGRLVKYRLSDVQAYLDSQRIAPYARKN